MKAWLPLAVLGAICASAAPAALVTGPAGGDQPYDNLQSYLAMNQVLTTIGSFPPADPTLNGSFSASHYIGMMRTLAGVSRPGTSVYADGAIYPIASNTDLFSVLGPYYGGNNATTFALPDLQGRTIIGTGQGPGLSNYVIGSAPGSASNTLTVAQMPAHAHAINVPPGQTGVTGASQPIDNMQPSLAMTYMIATGGVFQGGYNFIGQVSAFAGDFAPTGWLPADGRLVAIADFETLFNLVGTTYGGDGVTHFALPDLRGRTIVGAGDDYAFGQAVGTETTTLTSLNLPLHDHDGGAIEVDPFGGSQAFNNMQPSLALTYYVATSGVFPLESNVDPNSSDPFLGEIVASATDPQLNLNGYLPAFGQLLPINQNQALFALFGTAYGGNGITTFALPDLRNRIIVGTGPGYLLGQTGGQNALTLTEANLPVHVHALPAVVAAVPEPATWASMLLGFGMAGAAIRRRRVRLAA